MHKYKFVLCFLLHAHDLSARALYVACAEKCNLLYMPKALLFCTEKSKPLML